MSDSLEEDWRILGFDLRLSCHYHQERRRFFEAWNNVAALAGLLLSSAAAVTLIGDGSKTKLALWFAFGVAVVQGFALVINFPQKASLHRDLQRRFIDLITYWKSLPPTAASCVGLQKARLAIEKDEPAPMPYLTTRCHIDVMRRDESPREEWPQLHWWQRAFAQYLPEMG